MTAFPAFINTGAFPGITAVVETTENQIWYGELRENYVDQATLSGAARDVGNTGNTDKLRAGLLLGEITATKKMKEWNPAATDGSERIAGILLGPLDTVEGGSDRDLWVAVMRMGNVLDEGILVPGNNSFGLSGDDYEYLVAEQLANIGLHTRTKHQFGFGAQKSVAATSTLDEKSSGMTITDVGATGATIITIPNPKPNLTWKFVNAVAQQRTIVPASLNKIIGIDEAGTGYDDDIDKVVMTGQGSAVTLRGIEVGTDTYQYVIDSIVRCTTLDAES